MKKPKLKPKKTKKKTDSPHKEEYGSYCSDCGNSVFLDEERFSKSGKVKLKQDKILK